MLRGHPSAALPDAIALPDESNIVDLQSNKTVGLLSLAESLTSTNHRHTLVFAAFSGGNMGGGAYRIGGGVSPPTVIYKVEPEFSEEARKAKYQGTVVLSVEVDVSGRPAHLMVLSSLGLGLDQKALEAVAQWRFKPALRDGKPFFSQLADPGTVVTVRLDR